MSVSEISYLGKTVKFSDLEPGDYISDYILRGEWYESGNAEFIRNLGAEGNYADVGAYIGTYALFFALFCPSQTVYAFEPQQDIYQKLCANVKANLLQDRCVAWNVALDEKPGYQYLSGGSAAWNRGGTIFSPCDALHAGAVEARTLDSFNLNISVLKVDAESAELRILRGAPETLKQVQHVFVELWPEKLSKDFGFSYDFDEVASLLGGAGFTLQPDVFTDRVFYFKRTRL